MQEQEYIVQEASVAQESTEGTHVIESEQALAAVIENLLAEEKQVQMQYENFALQAALQNEGFGNYLLQGYAMQDAYVLSHQKELMEARIAKEKEKWLAQWQAQQNRVQESALATNTANVPTCAGMTRAQREAIARRVARGEEITF
ncbi:MAG: hypothetical protein SPL05_07335 [Eubacteriales bacterium]|nr:hypothetical protein [Eubacteriales bacterium]